jgi:hypothetical protein
MGEREGGGSAAGGAGGEGEAMARGELVEALVDGEGRREAAEAKEGGEGRGIDGGGGDAGEGAEGGEFGGEGEEAAGGSGGILEPAPVEGLLAEAIADEVEGAVLAIPEGEGKHAHGAVEGGIEPEGLDGGEEGFGVGMAAPGAVEKAGGFEVVAEVEVVVDLAVEGEDVATGGAGHWLVAGSGEIEDREAAMGEGEASGGLAPVAGIIGTAVGEGRGHGPGAGFEGSGGGGGGLPEAGEAAHQARRGRQRRREGRMGRAMSWAYCWRV